MMVLFLLSKSSRAHYQSHDENSEHSQTLQRLMSIMEPTDFTPDRYSSHLSWPVCLRLVHANQTSHAAMSGVAVTGRKTGGGAGRKSAATTRPRFPPEGPGLDGRGRRPPEKLNARTRTGESEACPFAYAETGLTRQPQEHKHSAAPWRDAGPTASGEAFK